MPPIDRGSRACDPLRAMTNLAQSLPAILPGLSGIAGRYDALLCDVWGVLHDGQTARAPAVDALRRFRETRGPVILLSNAPRPEANVKAQFVRFGVPEDCYDAIETSGMAAREEIERRTSGTRLRMLHLGPERDRGVFVGLAVDCVTADRAKLVLCTGLYDDQSETPGDYRELLDDLCARGLTMLCANPDIVVQHGGKLIYCAGALARAYKKIGGEVIYTGKPHRPVYEAALATAEAIAGRPVVRPLAVGDGLATDIAGANVMGFDAVFIADGVHGEEIGRLTPERLAELFKSAGVTARTAMPALAW